MHENIVQVYDVGKDRGLYYFAMELVEGGTVEDQFAEVDPLPIKRALGFIIQIAHALEAAEKHHIIHRDIKPENIMLTRQGTAKLADMGLAKSLKEEKGLTASGVAMGTPWFMPPEQATDARSVDHRGDIYSLGATFYRMVTGQPPFDGRNATEIMMKVVQKQCPPAHEINTFVPVSVSKVIGKMMAKDPNKRFQTAVEMLRVLEKLENAIDRE
jgi:serine/threonine-protein kinase